MDSITPRSVERRRGLRGSLRGRAPLAVTAVVALLVGGVAGTALGWKVEQRRVKSDLENIRPIGEITGVSGDTVSVRLSSSDGSREFTVTDETVVNGATGRSAGDLARGARVLVRVRPGSGDLEAAEIVVLPDVPET
jgi:hypothetical protein